MIATVLAAAATAVAAPCDVEHPSGRPGCTRAAVDALPMNAIQVIGTHNSYKRAIPENEMALIRRANPKAADTLDYSHIPLARQLDAGARQLEIDFVYDPQPGLYATPLAARLVGDKWEPYD